MQILPVNLWKSRLTNRTMILPVLMQIQELTMVLGDFDITFVKRETNLAAHLTAKFSLHSSPVCF